MLPLLSVKEILPASSSRKGVDIRTECPATGVPAFRDGVLYPGGEVVELRAIEREDDVTLRISMRGARRPVLENSRLLLPPQGEMLLARRALVLSSSPPADARIDRVPRPGECPARIESTACSLEPAAPAPPHARGAEPAMTPFILRAERPLPLIPGRRYEIASGVSALVVLAGPAPLDIDMDALAARISGADALDPTAVEELYLSVYGITPRLAPEPYAPSTSGAKASGRAFTHWLPGEEYLADLGELLSEVLRNEGALPTAVARELCESDSYFLPRTLWRELLAAFESEGRIVRQQGRIVQPRTANADSDAAAGAGALSSSQPADDRAGTDAHLSPAERSVLERIAGAGTAGEHVKSQAMRPARGILSRLEELGLIVRLDNGRLYDREAYRGFARLQHEVDDRRAASQWGVSRNTAQHLMRRLVADGLLVRTSPRTVAPRDATGGQQ